MTIEALVFRKVRDLVRDAAEDVLNDWGAPVSAVERAEIWSFTVDAADPAEEVRRALEETTAVVNPNIHLVRMDGWGAPPDRGCRAFVRVTDRVDTKGAAVLRALRDRRGMASFTEVRRSVLWILDLDTEDPAEAKRAVAGLARTDRRSAGLLANPHAQDVCVEVVSA
ncbi:MAG: hypothetical protein QF819_01060 [Gemmatimonadota bacterium]|jgi:phosphoribosylformylglycinamidine (FGAM) synthase PurS component|nr:hypothetical protein [Gemmatimonadota bacterium]MDP6801756.1 hypothetical protein [Gemmatimonadota bacterium]MDP7031168.1 hypothetical protein [Gemmatimonadota bacterium]